MNKKIDEKSTNSNNMTLIDSFQTDENINITSYYEIDKMTGKHYEIFNYKDQVFEIKKNKKFFICPNLNCFKKFDEVGNLKCHIRTHTGEKPYQCSFKECQKRFTTYGNLKNHENLHLNYLPYKCHYANCDASYLNHSRLETHVRTHEGKKPYICMFPRCRKSFNEKGNLKTHSRIHTGEKPYKCIIPCCEKEFKALGHLNDHKKTHIDQFVFKCVFCPLFFFNKKKIKNHIKLTHNKKFSKSFVYFDEIPVKQTFSDDKILIFENFLKNEQKITQFLRGKRGRRSSKPQEEIRKRKVLRRIHRLKPNSDISIKLTNFSGKTLGLESEPKIEKYENKKNSNFLLNGNTNFDQVGKTNLKFSRSHHPKSLEINLFSIQKNSTKSLKNSRNILECSKSLKVNKMVLFENFCQNTSQKGKQNLNNENDNSLFKKYSENINKLFDNDMFRISNKKNEKHQENLREIFNKAKSKNYNISQLEDSIKSESKNVYKNQWNTNQASNSGNNLTNLPIFPIMVKIHRTDSINRKIEELYSFIVCLSFPITKKDLSKSLEFFFQNSKPTNNDQKDQNLNNFLLQIKGFINNLINSEEIKADIRSIDGNNLTNYIDVLKISNYFCKKSKYYLNFSNSINSVEEFKMIFESWFDLQNPFSPIDFKNKVSCAFISEQIKLSGNCNNFYEYHRGNVSGNLQDIYNQNSGRNSEPTTSQENSKDLFSHLGLENKPDEPQDRHERKARINNINLNLSLEENEFDQLKVKTQTINSIIRNLIQCAHIENSINVNLSLKCKPILVGESIDNLNKIVEQSLDKYIKNNKDKEKIIIDENKLTELIIDEIDMKIGNKTLFLQNDLFQNDCNFGKLPLEINNHGSFNFLDSNFSNEFCNILDN